MAPQTARVVERASRPAVLVSRHPPAYAVMMYTSGTTSASKGVLLTNANVLHAATGSSSPDGDDGGPHGDSGPDLLHHGVGSPTQFVPWAPPPTFTAASMLS